MKLKIENLAKIKSAQLNLNGITIVVGDNNTGKSTIGKVLYAIFNSMLNFTDRVKRDRYQNCLEILSEVMPRSIRRRGIQTPVSGDVIQDFLSRKKTDEEIKYVLDTLARARGIAVNTQKIMEYLREVREPSDAMMRNRLIQNYFASVFSGQYLSMTNPKKGALVDLNVGGGEVRVMLRKRTTSYKADIEILHPAYYVDSPNLLNAVGGYGGDSASRLSGALLDGIRDGIMKRSARDRSVVAEVMSGIKLSAIMSKLMGILGGQLIVNEGGELVYRPSQNKLKIDLDVSNMSQGLKSFGLLLAAIKFGAIRKGDVLILDEPEIHLHPDWQIKYAELIVLIQQAFDLTILLTSHSADFIQAIRLYSKKYGTFDCVNAYVSSVNAMGEAGVKEVVHEDWDLVFSRFEKSFDLLMRVESELEASDEKQVRIQ